MSLEQKNTLLFSRYSFERSGLWQALLVRV